MQPLVSSEHGRGRVLTLRAANTATARRAESVVRQVHSSVLAVAVTFSAGEWCTVMYGRFTAQDRVDREWFGFDNSGVGGCCNGGGNPGARGHCRAVSEAEEVCGSPAGVRGEWERQERGVDMRAVGVVSERVGEVEKASVRTRCRGMHNVAESAAFLEDTCDTVQKWTTKLYPLSFN